jgi:hypothetical protein
MKQSRFSTGKQCASREPKKMSLVRIAFLLTVGAMIVILSSLVWSGDPNLWILVGPLCLVTVSFIWAITLTIGWFVMFAVGIFRIARRLERGVRVKTGHRGQVWDRWMDGPEPLLP